MDKAGIFACLVHCCAPSFQNSVWHTAGTQLICVELDKGSFQEAHPNHCTPCLRRMAKSPWRWHLAPPPVHSDPLLPPSRLPGRQPGDTVAAATGHTPGDCPLPYPSTSGEPVLLLPVPVPGPGGHKRLAAMRGHISDRLPGAHRGL